MQDASKGPQLTPSAQGRSPAQPVPMNYDVVSFARSVMVSDVQKLFTSASFPPELRMQVMKAGVPYNTTSKLSLRPSMKTIEGLKNEAHDLLLFPPREHWYQLDVWADEETSNIIRSTAEQAFLQTAMFKLSIEGALPIVGDEDWMSGLPSIPAMIGSRLHYLELNTTIQCHLDLYDQHLYLDVDWCGKAATYIEEEFELHFPNLKACVLTLDLSFSKMYGRTLHPFDQRALEWATGTDDDYDYFETSLPVEASSLFDSFAARGPGTSRFVRIRFFPGTLHGEHTNGIVHYGPLVKLDRETMAAESEEGSLGTKLFEGAYRLSRTCGQPAASARILRQ